ncbi:hypothetical protein WDW37_10045 [Bdellovibrionota bacterium FG-1]
MVPSVCTSVQFALSVQGVGLADTVGVGDAVGDSDGEGVGVAESVGVGVGVGVSLAEALGVGVTAAPTGVKSPLELLQPVTPINKEPMSMTHTMFRIFEISYNQYRRFLEIYKCVKKNPVSRMTADRAESTPTSVLFRS